MSHFASAVHIVTTDGPAGRRGVTVTSVVSVSDAPATLLVCVNASNDLNGRFEANGNFAVNTLAAGSQALAKAFAGEGGLTADERFRIAGWHSLETGAPILRDTLAGFDCRIVESRVVATHHVLIGEVVAIAGDFASPPLLYHARGYRLF